MWKGGDVRKSDVITCYNGEFVTAEQRARLSVDQVKTCLMLNERTSEDGSGLFLYAPRTERASQGVWINSSLYGFVAWARAKKAESGSLASAVVEAEYERRRDD